MAKHRVHTPIPEEQWKLLRTWCDGSPTGITPTGVLRTLLTQFIEFQVKPDLQADKFATADYEKLSRGLAHALKNAPSFGGKNELR